MHILKIVLILIALFILLVIIVGYALSAKGYDGSKSNHFDGKKFLNKTGIPANGLKDVLKYVITRKPESWTRNYETYVRDIPLPSPDSNEVSVTFVNHSTFIIQYKKHSFDWWDEQKINSLNIQSVPANHFTSRGTFDRDQTLWCGYILNMNGHKIYFAGDTGYGDVFKEIGNRIGAIDVSLIPIGAYLPRWFMSPIHVSPKESVLIHKDVNSKHSIGMHFGTFALADDGPDRPIKDLTMEKKAQGIDDKDFIVPDEGHSYSFRLK